MGPGGSCPRKRTAGSPPRVPRSQPKETMKSLFASALIASLCTATFAQAPATAAKPAAKKAAAAKPAAAKPAAKPAPAAVAARRQAAKAIELTIPLEDADPSDKLTPVELEIAKRVYVGDIACELGAKVVIKARKRPGYFLVTHGINRFVMHPVESRTGAIRLEDPERGALYLQIANKSMLMNQKEGKRLADECQSPEQAKVAAVMKNSPPINILEPAPAAPVAPAPQQAQTGAGVTAPDTAPPAAAAPAPIAPAQ
jgi:hypothetical protein